MKLNRPTLLTPHFTLEELTVTDTGLPNIPADVDVERLKRLASRLEEVRYALGNRPMRILSAFRSEVINYAAKGSRTSAHLRGDAADFTCAEYGSPRQICLAIIDAEIEFDQLILEPTWVHIGLSERPRNQVLTYKNHKYYPGLQE